VRVGCGLDAKFPRVGFGLLIFDREEGIALFRCHVGAPLGTRHITRTDGAIAGITTPGNGSEGKDVQKVLPVAMCQLGRL